MPVNPISTPWFSIPRPQPQAQVRLFGFPHAGGGSILFRPWLPLTPPTIEWCLLHMPGREQRLREPHVQQWDALIAQLVEAITPLLTRPAVFLGHSLGTFVAFELARALVRQQQTGPVHLVVSGQRAPHIPNPRPPIHLLPEAAFVEAIQQRYDAIPAPILQEPELLALFLPTVRADLTLLEEYTYQEDAPLACPISAFGGDADPVVTETEIAAWQEQTRGAFCIRMFPGGHFFLNDARSAIIEAITHDLADMSGFELA